MIPSGGRRAAGSAGPNPRVGGEAVIRRAGLLALAGLVLGGCGGVVGPATPTSSAVAGGAAIAVDCGAIGDSGQCLQMIGAASAALSGADASPTSATVTDYGEIGACPSSLSPCPPLPTAAGVVLFEYAAAGHVLRVQVVWRPPSWIPVGATH